MKYTWIIGVLGVMVVASAGYAETNMQRAEKEADRGAGRVRDQGTWDLNRIRESQQPGPIGSQETLRRIDRDQTRQQLMEQQQKREAERHQASVPVGGRSLLIKYGYDLWMEDCWK